MKHLKHLPLEGAFNCRDLGGYPAAKGKGTRWGLLYRSDSLAAITEADWRTLKNRGIKTVIDLRSKGETAAAPIRASGGIKWLQLPLLRELERNVHSSSGETILQSMKLDYVKNLYGNLDRVARVMNAILEAMENGAVVFLCSAGKDRTGIIAALCLYLCGVPREDIIADYMVSSTYNVSLGRLSYADIPEQYMEIVPDMQRFKECLASKPETMVPLLDAFEESGIENLLDQNGFSIGSQHRFIQSFTQAVE